VRKWLLLPLLLISVSQLFAWGTAQLPHFASLSPKMMHYYFQWNREVASDSTTNKWVKYDWNLQYLIGESWVSTYLTLNKKHQNFIQKLADLILTDEYAKNIEENKRNKTRNYNVISIKWNKKFKTARLSSVIQLSINLLQDIELVTTWVDWRYERINKLLQRFESKNWYKVNPQIYNLLETLQPEIDWVLAVHKLINEKGLAQKKDFTKKQKIILAEIKKIEEENNKLDTILEEEIKKWKEKDTILEEEIKKWKEKDTILKEKDIILKEEIKKWKEKDTILKEKDIILKEEIKKWKEKDEKLKELDQYLNTLNRFLDVTSKSN